MKTISRRKNAFAAFAWLGAIFIALVLANGMWRTTVLFWILLPFGTLACGSMIIFWLLTCRRLQTARLIAENHILHICLAAADGMKSEMVEAYISYFGILLGSKIIKFNQDGIFLKAIEIGGDFISLSYGTDKWIKKTRLLRPAVSSGELEILAQRFRDETGIVSTVLN